MSPETLSTTTTPPTVGGGGGDMVPKKIDTIGPYKLGKTLGTGSFGKVKQAIHQPTGQEVAIKIINGEVTGIEREVMILKLLNHPNIVKLIEVITAQNKMYIVLELVTGGDLFERIVHNGYLSENDSRKLFRQMVSALEYCHGSLIAHRDLKPENIMLDSNGNVKITDFGFSKMMRGGQFLQTMCGSPVYAAPEILMAKGYAGTQSDIWSLGMVLFAMVAGHLPWPVQNADIKTQLRALYSTFAFPNHFSVELCHLLKRMINPDPTLRVTLVEIRKHPWVNRGYADLPPCYLEKRSARIEKIDEEVLMQLIPFEFNMFEARRSILSNEQCLVTSIYHLLYEQKYPHTVISKTEKPAKLALPLQKQRSRRFSISEGMQPLPEEAKHHTSPRAFLRLLGRLGDDKHQQQQNQVGTDSTISPRGSPPHGRSPRDSLPINSTRPASPLSGAVRGAAVSGSSSPTAPSSPRKGLALKMRGLFKLPSGRPRRLSGDIKEAYILSMDDNGSNGSNSDYESNSGNNSPRRIKALSKNMISLPHKPEEIFKILESLLHDLNIDYKQDGSTFHCTYKKGIQQMGADTTFAVVTFTVDVCDLHNEGAVKIKRRSGDSWAYKSIFSLLASSLGHKQQRAKSVLSHSVE